MNLIKNDSPNVLRWGGDDAFTHTLVIGPTRCGKTATVLRPLIFQILEERAKGKKVGLSVLEPKGDVIKDMKKICDAIGEEMVYIDPTEPDKTDSINVMQGDKHSVAEATVAVLKAMFGKQEAFFATIQEMSARNITLLLKELYGDQVYITHVLENLRNESILRKNIQLLKQKGTDPDLVEFFENELLDGKVSEKYRQLVMGLRAQLENITSNEYLRPIITRPSSINLDDHFENGGILGVNTALGLTGKAGDAFGQFIAMHLQLATFRRKGTERTRIPHYLIIDEYSRYINPDVERFLSIAAEYRVALIAAIQSLGQIEMESGMITAKAMKQAILTNCRNKIIFGGLSAPDAKELATELGKDTVLQREKTFDGEMSKRLVERSFREKEMDVDRFKYTLLMDGLPRFHFVHKLLKNGHPQKPGIAVGSFTPRDPIEIKEHFNRIKKGTIEEELREIRENPAPIWDIQTRFRQFKRRLSLEVALNQYEERKERLENVLNKNPFTTVTVVPEVSDETEHNEQNDSAPKITYRRIKHVKKERSQEERRTNEERMEEQNKQIPYSVECTTDALVQLDSTSEQTMEKSHADCCTETKEPVQPEHPTEKEEDVKHDQEVKSNQEKVQKNALLVEDKQHDSEDPERIAILPVQAEDQAEEKQKEDDQKNDRQSALSKAPTQDFWDKLFQ